MRDRTGQVWAEPWVIYVMIGAPKDSDDARCVKHPVFILYSEMDGYDTGMQAMADEYRGDPWEEDDIMTRLA